MQKVVVIGSLTTYEIARLLPTSSFQIVLYLAQTRLSSLLGCGVPFELGYLDASPDLPSKLMYWDLSKSYKTQLLAVNPDIIILDAINERFDLIEYNSQYFTKTDILTKSGLLENEMKGYRILSQEESLAVFRNSAKQIGEFLSSVTNKVILHEAYCAQKRSLDGATEFFSQNSTEVGRILNSRLGSFYETINNSFVNLATVESSPEFAIADGARYGGEIPYIYSPSCKQQVADKIANLDEIKWIGFMNWGRALKKTHKPTQSTSTERLEEFFSLCRLNRIEFYETQGPIPFQSNSLLIQQTLVRYSGNRYLYYTHRVIPGRPLVVVFSGVTSTPAHNYMNYYKFMYDLDASVLFIPDTAGAHGCYYTMINGTNEIIDTNLAIISKVICDSKVPLDQVYLVGTSKGGTAALLHSLLLGFGHAISGEPQIKIGDYLFDSKGPQFQSIIYTMTGRIDTIDRGYLNDMLDRVAVSTSRQYSGHMQIIVGDATDYYEKHIKYFIDTCSDSGLVNNLTVATVPLNYHGNVNIPFTELIYNVFGYLISQNN